MTKDNKHNENEQRTDDNQNGPPEDGHTAGGQPMTHRQQTHRDYHEPRLFREPRGGMPVPESWPADERFWHQLDTNLKALYVRDEYELPPLDLDTFPGVGDRRGQWANPDLVEADVSWPPLGGERGVDYSLPDVEWEKMTPDEQRRYMAL